MLLSVPYTQQEATRRIETEVNLMFDTWRSRFPGKSDREILAMIAFRYAERYAALLREREEQAEAVEKVTARLRQLLDSGDRTDSV